MKKRRIIIIGIIVVLLCILVPVYLNHPSRAYRKALSLFSRQDYNEAYSHFESATGYKDSDQYIKYIDSYRLYEEGKYADAEQGFAELGDFLDSEQLVKACVEKEQVEVYSQAISLFEGQQFAEANEQFELLGNYEDAEKYSAYSKAMTAFEDGQYQEAREGFLLIPGFLDADSWADSSERMEHETKYREALSALSEGRLEDAKVLLSEIDFYEDAGQYIHYIDGQIAYQNGQFAEAEKLFVEAGDLLDSKTWAETSNNKYLSQQYQKAVRLFKTGKSKESQEVFETIREYADSEDYLSYMNAMSAMDEEKYGEAAETFERLGNFLDSKKQMETASEMYAITEYQDAVADFEAGNFKKAAERFEKLDTYKDSESYVHYIRGLLAADAEEYLEAAEQFAYDLSFKDSEEKRAESVARYEKQQYDLAAALVADAKLDEAKEIFLSLDHYEDSDRYIEYIEAKKALDEGNFAESESRFEALGDFLDSQDQFLYSEQQLQPERYAAAREALDAEEYESAIELFDQLGNYLDAESYAQYARAKQTAYAGDFKDASEMLEEISSFADSQVLARYYEARQFETELDYEKAREAYLEIAPYLDSEERLKHIPDLILSREYLALEEKLTGRRWWNQRTVEEIHDLLGKTYQDEGLSMKENFLSLSDALLDNGAYERSYALLSAMREQYPEDEEIIVRMTDVQYQYARSEMENGEFKDAEWMLDELVAEGDLSAAKLLVECLEQMSTEAAEENPELAAQYAARMETLKKQIEEAEASEKDESGADDPEIDENVSQSGSAQFKLINKGSISGDSTDGDLALLGAAALLVGNGTETETGAPDTESGEAVATENEGLATPDEALATPDEALATPDEAVATPDEAVAAQDEVLGEGTEASAMTDKVLAEADEVSVEPDEVLAESEEAPAGPDEVLAESDEAPAGPDEVQSEPDGAD